MIHPEEIRALVRQGRIPENWRIIRGSGFSAMRGAWGITAWIPSINAPYMMPPHLQAQVQ